MDELPVLSINADDSNCRVAEACGTTYTSKGSLFAEARCRRSHVDAPQGGNCLCSNGHCLALDSVLDSCPFAP